MTVCKRLSGFPKEAVKGQRDISDGSGDAHLSWETKKSSIHLSYDCEAKLTHVIPEDIPWLCKEMENCSVPGF